MEASSATLSRRRRRGHVGTVTRGQEGYHSKGDRKVGWGSALGRDDRPGHPRVRGPHTPTNHPVSGFPFSAHPFPPPTTPMPYFPKQRTRNQEQLTLNHPTHLPLNLVAFLASRSVSLALSLAAISDIRTSARRTLRSLASADIFDSNSASLSPARTFFWAGLLG